MAIPVVRSDEEDLYGNGDTAENAERLAEIKELHSSQFPSVVHYKREFKRLIAAYKAKSGVEELEIIKTFLDGIDYDEDKDYMLFITQIPITEWVYLRAMFGLLELS